MEVQKNNPYERLFQSINMAQTLNTFSKTEIGENFSRVIVKCWASSAVNVAMKEKVQFVLYIAANTIIGFGDIQRAVGEACNV